MLTPWKESYDQPRQHIKKQRHYFANKRPSSLSYGFSSSHVRMWELDSKESWAPKNWCFLTVVWRRLLRVPWTARRSNQSNRKGDQPWIFIGRTDAEAEAPVLWPPDAKSQLTGKDPNAGKDWRWKEKGTREDEMVGCHQWTWVWVKSGSWWCIGKPGMLQFMGLQRVGYNLVTEQQ